MRFYCRTRCTAAFIFYFLATATPAIAIDAIPVRQFGYGQIGTRQITYTPDGIHFIAGFGNAVLMIAIEEGCCCGSGKNNTTVDDAYKRLEEYLFLQ